MDRQWQLIRVDPTERIQDESGAYVLINWDRSTDSVRLDVFTAGGEPLVSFVGYADDVRKHTMRWLTQTAEAGGTMGSASLEHAAYIGAELERADTERIDYVQD